MKPFLRALITLVLFILIAIDVGLLAYFIAVAITRYFGELP